MACKLAMVTNSADAWQAWKPSRSQPWDRRWAAHLFRRAAFGADWSTLDSAVQRGHGDTLDGLLHGGNGMEPFHEQAVRDAARLVDRPLRDSVELQGLWMRRMLHSPYPFLEKMTLFWHNHFATSVAKVGRVSLMQRQNDLLRHNALGKFGSLLSAVSRDPAMLIWLDSDKSVQGRPNENYAREIMEAFVLGNGTFTEEDVQEVARAFTGWSVVGDEFRLNESHHDVGLKTVLGQTGPWNGDDVIRILLQQPAAARFLVRKLFRFFLSETEEPPDQLIEPLARELRQSNYDIFRVVGMMLRSNLFFSEYSYRQRIKSPIEFVLGMVNHLRIGTPDVSPFQLASQVEELGQKLYSPPSVFGWEGGTAWIHSGQLLARHNLAFEFAMSRFRRDNPANLVARYGGKTSTEQVAFLVSLLLDGVLNPRSRKRLVDFLEDQQLTVQNGNQPERELVHLIMLLPEYQLA